MKKLGNVTVILVSALLILIVYTLLHEGGHALFAVLFGGKITEFVINPLTGTPHVSWVGELEDYERAIVSAAGPLLPYILVITSYFVLRKNQNPICRMTMFLASIGVLGSFIPNIIIPFLYEAGVNVQNEDIARFIQYSGFNSYLTALAAAILLAIGIVLVVKNTNLKELFSNNLITKTGKRYAVTWVIGAAAVVLLVYSCINVISSNIQSYSFKVPKEYSHLLVLDLTSIGDVKSNVYEFEITEPKMYDFYVVGDTKEKVEIKLIGTGNMPNLRINEMIIYSAFGKANSSFTNWCLNKGKYTLELTKQESKGRVKIYMTEKAIEDPSQVIKYSNGSIFQGNIPELENGYELVLRDRILNVNEKNIYEFNIEQDKNVQFSIFLTTRTGKAVLILSGNGHEEELISEYQVLTMGRGAALKKGSYKLLLTSNDCDGEIYIFMKTN